MSCHDSMWKLLKFTLTIFYQNVFDIKFFTTCDSCYKVICMSESKFLFFPHCVLKFATTATEMRALNYKQFDDVHLVCFANQKHTVWKNEKFTLT